MGRMRVNSGTVKKRRGIRNILATLRYTMMPGKECSSNSSSGAAVSSTSLMPKVPRVKCPASVAMVSGCRAARRLVLMAATNEGANNAVIFIAATRVSSTIATKLSQ